MNFLTSEEFLAKFNERLNEIPKGDERRAQMLFRLWGQFYLYYRTNNSITLSDRAIALTSEALEEMPKPHSELEMYWSRVWIVQEVVLARQALVHYGRYIIPMDVFLDAERYFRRHYYDCCYDQCTAMANNKWSMIYSQLKKLSQIESMQLRLARKAETKISLFDSMMGRIDSRKAINP